MKKIASIILPIILTTIVVFTCIINAYAGSGCIVSVSGDGSSYAYPRATARTKATLIKQDPDGSGLGASNSYCDAFVYLYWYNSDGNRQYYSDYSTTSSPCTFFSPYVSKWGTDPDNFSSEHKGYVVYKGVIEQVATATINDY